MKAPASIGLMSTGPKAALLRALACTVATTSSDGCRYLDLAALSNDAVTSRLMQNNVKRMAAYSSIAHAGYLLVAFAASNRLDLGPISYTASYRMNWRLPVVTHFAPAANATSCGRYSGLTAASPCSRSTLTIFMLSLIGYPDGASCQYTCLTQRFGQCASDGACWLTIIGLYNSALHRILPAVDCSDYMRDPVLAKSGAASGAMRLAGACAIATIYLGVMPGRVLKYRSRARDRSPPKRQRPARRPQFQPSPAPCDYSGKYHVAREDNAARPRKAKPERLH